MKIRPAGNNAFTMVELMTVVGVIAVIVGIAVPSWMRARENAQKAQLINELRNTVESFQTYASEQNSLPATSTFQQIPARMAPYMPKNSTWTGSPGGGGYWCWLNLSSKVGNYNAFVGIYGSGLSQSSLQEIDSTIDDGNLATGAFTTQGVDTSGDPTAGNGGWMFMGVQGY